MDSNLTPDDWLAAQRVLKAVLRDPALADEQPEFRTLVAGVNRLGRKHARQVAQTDKSAPARTAQRCYMCREPFEIPDPTNVALCGACGRLNSDRRAARADLIGRIAVLTGGRIKIGYATSLRLLRDGATVIVTTRFPQDALRRYSAEPDASQWLARLRVYGLDLRDVRAVEAFSRYIRETQPHLDILINNAAQTIARPMPFYSHLLDGERRTLPGTENLSALVAQSAPLHLLVDDRDDLAPFFPEGQFDAFGEQLDLRPSNSWTQRMDQIEPREWLEVQLINVTAPSLLCHDLLPLLQQSPFPRRFIVNVSAAEGQFSRRFRNDKHPHTNMAKAALNMLTRTSGPGLAREGIYMTSVDTGWVSQQEPQAQRDRMAARGFTLPIDTLDAVARIYDPIVLGLNHEDPPPSGVYLKDFRVQGW